MNEQVIRLDEINPWSVLLDILRNLWVIILVVVSVLMCFSAYQKAVYIPMYRSTATIVVSAKGNASAYTSLNLTQDMAQVFSEVFRSNVLLERVEEQLGEPLDGYISTNTITETNLMTVSVTSSSPEQAFQALNLFIENYPMISDYLYNNAVLEVIKDPIVPTVPSNSINSSRYQKILALFSTIISIVIIALFSILNDTVQTPKAAKRKLDGRLLRCIHHEEKNKTIMAKIKRKKSSPLVSNPFISLKFREDNQSLCSTLEYHMRKRGQKIILVSSVGENEGKSTVAANLALSMAAHNKQVLLLDCDFRKPALQKIFQLDIDQAHDFGYYIMNDDSDPNFQISLSKTGLHIGANRHGYQNVQQLIWSQKLQQYLEQVRETMDYIIIDSPPIAVAADTEALADMADVSVLVIRENYMCARVINDCLDILRRSTSDLAGYVFNDYRTSLLN